MSKIDNQQFEKDAIIAFENRFSNSEFWLDKYPQNYTAIKRFILEIVKDVEEKTKVYCLEQYQEFYEELKKKD